MRLASRPLLADPWRFHGPATRHAICAALAWVLGLGCYRDVPTALDHAPPGSSVRALIVVDGTTASPFGRRPGRSADREQLIIQGTLVQRDSARVDFLVPATRTAASLAYGPVDQLISVARQDVLRVALRRLDAKRTAGLIALIAGATVVAVFTASTEVGGTVSRPPPSGDVSIRGALPRGCCR